MPVGVLIVNDTGEIYYSNKKAKNIFKLSSQKHNKNNAIVDMIRSLKKDLIQPYMIDLSTEIFISSSVLDEESGNKIWGIVLYDGEYISNLIPQTSIDENRAILDSTQDAIFIDDKCGNTEWINKACEQLYHIKKEEIIGKNIDDLEKEGIFSPSVAKSVFNQKKQVTILHSNNQGKQILSTGTPIFDEVGEIKKIVSTSRDVSELIYLKNQLEDMENELQELKIQQQDIIGNIVVRSSKMVGIIELASRLAEIDSTVLITGDSGVGKGEIATHIHQLGSRKDQPFVKVNCGAIPESLLESELFGYEHGAFTGARKQGKIGMFELAQKGTIFLDEIGELPLNLQVKILQVIQEKEIKRVGGTTSIKVDVRIIAATNKDLKQMVNEKTFREDLYYRLNVVPIYIPPLKERQEDIFPLVHYFLERYNERFNVKKRIDPNAMAILIKYGWPGNVREVENIIERLVITTKDSIILPQNLPNYIMDKEDIIQDIKIPNKMNLKGAVEEVEKKIIKSAMDKYKTTREIAKALGVSQPTIVRKINQYKLNDTNKNQDDS